MVEKVLGNKNYKSDKEYRNALSASIKNQQSATDIPALYDRNYVTDYIAEQIEKAKTNLFSNLNKRNTNLMPEVIRKKSYALFYVAIVNYELNRLTYEQKEILIRAASGDRDDVSEAIVDSSNYDWCKKFMIPLNTDIYKASLVLGDHLGMSPENIFERRSMEEKDYNVKDKLLCPTLPCSLQAGNTLYKLFRSIPIYHANGMLLQTIGLYSTGDELVIMYAGESVYFGREKLPARLPNANLIAKYGNTIHICLCAEIAWTYIPIYNSQFLENKEKAVFTGCLRGVDDFQSLNLSNVSHHDVILHCTPDSCEWDKMDQIVNQCEQNFASSISIFPYNYAIPPIFTTLARKRSIPEVAINNLRDEWNKRDPAKSNEEKINAIERFSIPLEELENFKRRIGLVQDSKNKGKISIGEIQYYDEALTKSLTYKNDNNFDLSQMITSDNRTLIYAPSNSGKSFFALQLALSLVTGIRSFCFSCSKKKKIVILDGEIGDEFWQRLNQLTNWDKDLLQQAKGALGHYEVRNKDLHAEEVRKQVIKTILEKNPDVVFIDNIISIFPQSIKGNIKDFKEFINELEKHSIAVVMLHHTNKEGKASMGPTEFIALSQNIIYLKGKDELGAEYKKNKDPHDIAEKILSLPGAFINLYVEKCKVYPELEHRDYYYRLPTGGQWIATQKDGTSLPSPDQRLAIEQGGISALEADPRTAILSTDEKSVLAKVGEQRKITNKEVQTILHCRDSKASNLLRGLVEKGRLASEGKGRGVYYILPKAQED